MDWVRCGIGPRCGRGGGGVGRAGLDRCTLFKSTDCDRTESFSVLILLCGSVVVAVVVVVVAIPQCWANNERLSSMGVNILRDLAGTGLGIRFGWFSCGLGSRSGCGGDDMGGGCGISCCENEGGTDDGL